MPDMSEILECRSCGGEYPRGDMYDRCGEGCCGFRCYECQYGDDDDDDYGQDDDVYAGGRIHEWNWKPYQFDMKSLSSEAANAVFMGVELEVGHSATDVADAVDVVDGNEYHLYLKEDGSITGAEIVSHPMTLAWARSATVDFAELLSALNSRGCSVDSGYGMHVHVSRDSFCGPSGKRSTSHALAWLLFNSRNANDIQRLARRYGSRWASFCTPAPGELKRKAQRPPDRYERDNRYQAVNCNNEATYELRMFASTLDSEEFWAALEYADASVEYTRQLSAADMLKAGALRWPAFVRWVDANNYPNLSAQMRVQNTHISTEGNN